MILPQENEKDLSEIDPTVRASLRFVTAGNIDTVLENALLPAGESADTLPAPQLPKRELCAAVRQ